MKINNSVTNYVNKASRLNAVSSPNMARNLVGCLIVMNGVLRAAANEMDTKEKPAARHYGAMVEGLHNGFALIFHYAITPLCGLAGLFLGKHLLAKKAFANILPKMELSGIQKNFLAEQKLLSSKSKGFMASVSKFLQPVKNVIAKVPEAVKNVLKIDEIDAGIQKINEYNGTVIKAVRTNLEKGKQIIIQTGENTFAAIKASSEKGKDNILEALEGNKAVFAETGDKELLEKLEKQGKKLFVTPALKFIDNEKAVHNSIIGSQKFGEVLGMTTALTIISPLVTNKIVPPILKKLGLENTKHH